MYSDQENQVWTLNLLITLANSYMMPWTSMTSLKLKLLMSSKMNKTIYHLKALIKAYRKVLFSMTYACPGKSRALSFVSLLTKCQKTLVMWSVSVITKIQFSCNAYTEFEEKSLRLSSLSFKLTTLHQSIFVMGIFVILCPYSDKVSSI